METYIGTEIVNAKPMTRGEYNKMRGWTTPEGEDPNDSGYLMLDPMGAKNQTEFDGYVRWLPESEFNVNYKCTKSDTFDFSHAMQLIRRGFRLARKGWNGKGMYVFMEDSEVAICSNSLRYERPMIYEAANRNDSKCIKILPCLCMKSAQNTIIRGWLAAMPDLFGEDWYVVE